MNEAPRCNIAYCELKSGSKSELLEHQGPSSCGSRWTSSHNWGGGEAPQPWQCCLLWCGQQGAWESGCQGQVKISFSAVRQGKTHEPIQMLMSSGKTLEEDTLRNNAQWTVRITLGHTAWYMSTITWAVGASSSAQTSSRFTSTFCPWLPHLLESPLSGEQV